MNIKWIGANTANFGVGRSGKTVNKIVLHWMAGTLASTDATFQDPKRIASAHYGIGQTEIHQYVKEEDTAYHAGNLTVNKESIGIEHEGGPDIPITDSVYSQSIELVKTLCKKYSIPIDKDHILPHKAFKATQCPGTLDLDRIIREANVADVSDDQKRALDFINTNKGTSNFEGSVRGWFGDHQDKPSLESKANRLQALIDNLVQIWNLKAGSDEAEILTEAKMLLESEEVRQKYRDAIESIVGEFDTDIALLEALGAVGKDKLALNQQIKQLQQKLDDAKVPSGYKISKSWKLFGDRYLVKMYKKVGD